MPEDNVTAMQYQSLYPEFRERVDRLREHSEIFRVTYEPYELFCCLEAQKIIEKIGTEENPLERIRLFMDENERNRRRLVPQLLYEQHTPNTFGCACFLAMMYVTTPDRIQYAHGAGCTMIGCVEYGCNDAQAALRAQAQQGAQ